MGWDYYLTGNEIDVTQANAQIQINAGIPCPGTQIWDIPAQAYQQDFWFIAMPPPWGWNDISQEQMMQNVTNVAEQQCQSNWWPPYPPTNGMQNSNFSSESIK